MFLICTEIICNEICNNDGQVKNHHYRKIYGKEQIIMSCGVLQGSMLGPILFIVYEKMNYKQISIKKSSWQMITWEIEIILNCGIPQGSVLGSTLFII